MNLAKKWQRRKKKLLNKFGDFGYILILHGLSKRTLFKHIHFIQVRLHKIFQKLMAALQVN